MENIFDALNTLRHSKVDSMHTLEDVRERLKGWGSSIFDMKILASDYFKAYKILINSEIADLFDSQCSRCYCDVFILDFFTCDCSADNDNFYHNGECFGCYSQDLTSWVRKCQAGYDWACEYKHYDQTLIDQNKGKLEKYLKKHQTLIDTKEKLNNLIKKKNVKIIYKKIEITEKELKELEKWGKAEELRQKVQDSKSLDSDEEEI
jgi:hypothetical protein